MGPSSLSIPRLYLPPPGSDILKEADSAFLAQLDALSTNTQALCNEMFKLALDIANRFYTTDYTKLQTRHQNVHRTYCHLQTEYSSLPEKLLTRNAAKTLLVAMQKLQRIEFVLNVIKEQHSNTETLLNNQTARKGVQNCIKWVMHCEGTLNSWSFSKKDLLTTLIEQEKDKLNGYTTTSQDTARFSQLVSRAFSERVKDTKLFFNHVATQYKISPPFTTSDASVDDVASLIEKLSLSNDVDAYKQKAAQRDRSYLSYNGGLWNRGITFQGWLLEIEIGSAKTMEQLYEDVTKEIFSVLETPKLGLQTNIKLYKAVIENLKQELDGHRKTLLEQYLTYANRGFDYLAQLRFALTHVENLCTHLENLTGETHVKTHQAAIAMIKFLKTPQSLISLYYAIKAVEAAPSNTTDAFLTTRRAIFAMVLRKQTERLRIDENAVWSALEKMFNNCAVLAEKSIHDTLMNKTPNLSECIIEFLLSSMIKYLHFTESGKASDHLFDLALHVLETDERYSKSLEKTLATYEEFHEIYTAYKKCAQKNDCSQFVAICTLLANFPSSSIAENTWKYHKLKALLEANSQSKNPLYSIVKAKFDSFSLPESANLVSAMKFLENATEVDMAILPNLMSLLKLYMTNPNDQYFLHEKFSAVRCETVLAQAFQKLTPGAEKTMIENRRGGKNGAATWIALMQTFKTQTPLTANVIPLVKACEITADNSFKIILAAILHEVCQSENKNPPPLQQPPLSISSSSSSSATSLTSSPSSSSTTTTTTTPAAAAAVATVGTSLSSSSGSALQLSDTGTGIVYGTVANALHHYYSPKQKNGSQNKDG